MGSLHQGGDVGQGLGLLVLVRPDRELHEDHRVLQLFDARGVDALVPVEKGAFALYGTVEVACQRAVNNAQHELSKAMTSAL